jgi:hypothetical protein
VPSIVLWRYNGTPCRVFTLLTLGGIPQQEAYPVSIMLL